MLKKAYLSIFAGKSMHKFVENPKPMHPVAVLAPEAKTVAGKIIIKYAENLAGRGGDASASDLEKAVQQFMRSPNDD